LPEHRRGKRAAKPFGPEVPVRAFKQRIWIKGYLMSLLLIILLVVVLFGGGGGYYGYRSYGMGGLGGVLGLVLIIVLVLYLLGGVHALNIRLSWP
jgi:hypothetical protein